MAARYSIENKTQPQHERLPNQTGANRGCVTTHVGVWSHGPCKLRTPEILTRETQSCARTNYVRRERGEIVEFVLLWVSIEPKFTLFWAHQLEHAKLRIHLQICRDRWAALAVCAEKLIFSTHLCKTDQNFSIQLASLAIEMTGGHLTFLLFLSGTTSQHVCTWDLPCPCAKSNCIVFLNMEIQHGGAQTKGLRRINYKRHWERELSVSRVPWALSESVIVVYCLLEKFGRHVRVRGNISSLRGFTSVIHWRRVREMTQYARVLYSFTVTWNFQNALQFNEYFRVWKEYLTSL